MKIYITETCKRTNKIEETWHEVTSLFELFKQFVHKDLHDSYLEEDIQTEYQLEEILEGLFSGYLYEVHIIPNKKENV